ncbi:sensor histidine kinase [Cohnella fermenti]|uniref:Sensor histidine kinase n=1 Tax=Cohnella fermenti TaxID=2565925 RepID=A0A4S4BYM8_9BACL|nr:sensor histidine kinase [Cohnella fermenti]THF80348.1 sensor histidine kinase [Cohnella fermenti]
MDIGGQAAVRTGLERRVRQNMVLITSIPLLLVVVAICFYIAYDTTKEFNRGLRDAAESSGQLIANQIETVYLKSDMVVQNRYLLQALQVEYDKDIEKMLPLYDNLELLIAEPLGSRDRSFFTVYPYNESIYEGSFIERYDRIRDLHIEQKLQEAGASGIYWAEALSVRKYRGDAKFLQFYREIRGYNGGLGILEANISFAQLVQIADNTALPEKASLLLADGGGTVQYARGGTFAAAVGSPFDGKGYRTSVRTLNPSLTIIAAVPETVVLQSILRMVALVVLIFVVALTIMLYVSGYSSRMALRILKQFLDTLKTDERFWTADKFAAEADDHEIAIIKNKFYMLLERMNRLHEERLKADRDRAKFELELLQARINPHLLYNSLSVIKWNAQWNKDRRTSQLIDYMSRYYRASLNKGNTIVTVAEELAMVEDYVRINETSYNCSYELIIAADSDVRGRRIFKHMLQPIVENAILHGLNGREGGGVIRISIAAREGRTVFTVVDNGSGIPPERREQLLNGQSHPASPGGYGMKNLLRRLQMYFGPEAELAIDSEPGQGTEVSIWIPDKELEEEE